MLVLSAITVNMRNKRTAACWEIFVLIRARRIFRKVEAKTIPFSVVPYLLRQNLQFEACGQFNLATDRGAKTIGAAKAQLTVLQSYAEYKVVPATLANHLGIGSG